MTTQSEIQVRWLDPIQYPLANKFIRQHGFRGRVRSNDQCMVMRNQTEGIIALAFLRPMQQSLLLTAVAVAPDYQGQGLVKQLLGAMCYAFTEQTYTFSLNDLTSLYQQHGFSVVEEAKLPEDVSSRLRAYRDQGRLITPMIYEGSSST